MTRNSQRRVYAIVEMAFMLYRCLLPVPVWLEFYSKESDYFAALYLVLKVRRVHVHPVCCFALVHCLHDEDGGGKTHYTTDGVFSQLGPEAHIMSSILGSSTLRN